MIGLIEREKFIEKLFFFSVNTSRFRYAELVFQKQWHSLECIKNRYKLKNFNQIKCFRRTFWMERYKKICLDNVFFYVHEN